MYREYTKKGLKIVDVRGINNLYGFTKEFIECLSQTFDMRVSRNIYTKLLEKVIFKNGSLIPSRAEKTLNGIKWSITWKNLKMVGLDANEKSFAWKMVQDMLPIGKRIHRDKAEKRCLRKLNDISFCEVIPDLRHFFVECPVVEQAFLKLQEIVCNFLQRDILDKNLISLDFNHRNKKKVKIMVWLVTKWLYNIYMNKIFNKTNLLAEMRKQLNWNIQQLRKIGALDEMKLVLNLLN